MPLTLWLLLFTIFAGFVASSLVLLALVTFRVCSMQAFSLQLNVTDPQVSIFSVGLTPTSDTNRSIPRLSPEGFPANPSNIINYPIPIPEWDPPLCVFVVAALRLGLALSSRIHKLVHAGFKLMILLP